MKSAGFFTPLTASLILGSQLLGASAQATAYGLGAAEAEFLTETDGGSVSTFVGPKGVVTIVGHGVHDTFPDHGAFDAVWVESSNGVVFQASGSNYQEAMSCTVNRGGNNAECIFSNKVGASVFAGTFEPTAIPVLATLSASPTASTSSKPASSSSSTSSSSSAAASVSPSETSSQPSSTPAVSTPSSSATVPSLSITPTSVAPLSSVTPETSSTSAPSGATALEAYGKLSLVASVGMALLGSMLLF